MENEASITLKTILFNQFLDLSTEIGENINFVQGAGGNTSFKEGNSLYIKASGHKLKDSKKKNIFVEVNISKILNQLQNENPIKGAWDESKFLRPSIETTMHIIMPQKYVFTRCRGGFDLSQVVFPFDINFN